MKNEDNYIKMDGEKDSFEGGAIRYTKKGKGRYDLIPSQQIHDILDYAKLNWDNIIEKDDEFCSIHNVLMSAYPDADDLTYDNYIEIIINIIRYCYIVTSNNQNFYAFMMGFVKMLKDLAIHYEMGAEKYGVDNWKNGIPETKGERGGSFRDSGLRHLQQLLDGQTDEPHQISAIWNFIGAMYVKFNKRCESCDHHNERCEKEILSKLPIDIKDFITSLICTDATGSEIWTIKTSEEFLVLKKYDEELSFLIETMEIMQDAVDCGSITMTGKDVHSDKLYQIILSFNPVINGSLFTFKLAIKTGKTATLSHTCVTCWEDKFISNATTVDASDMDKLLKPLEKYMRKVNPV